MTITEYCGYPYPLLKNDIPDCPGHHPRTVIKNYKDDMLVIDDSYAGVLLTIKTAEGEEVGIMFDYPEDANLCNAINQLDEEHKKDKENEAGNE